MIADPSSLLAATVLGQNNIIIIINSSQHSTVRKNRQEAEQRQPKMLGPTLLVILDSLHQTRRGKLR